MPCSVPRYSSFGCLMSSRMARAKSVAPTPAVIAVQLSPKSSVRKTYGVEVVLLIAVRRDVRGPGAKRRRLNQADAGKVAQRLRA